MQMTFFEAVKASFLSMPISVGGQHAPSIGTSS
jgi:hypothetical protein